MFIFAWCAIVLHYLIQHIVIDDLSRPLTTILKPTVYTDVPINQAEGFMFAVGVSSPKNFNTLISDVATL